MLTRVDCPRVLQIWGVTWGSFRFLLSICHLKHSCSSLSRHFSSSLDTLAGSSPFGTFSDVDILLTTQDYIFWRSLPSLPSERSVSHLDRSVGYSITKDHTYCPSWSVIYPFIVSTGKGLDSLILTLFSNPSQMGKVPSK